jgi:hypothetical protein
MKNEATSMLPVLPCGVPFDPLKGECCASNCQETTVRDETDPKLRFRAIETCRHWATGQLKATVAKKKAAPKARKK